MGFLDALLGKSRLPKPKPDKLFAISTAYVTLNTNLNLKSTSYFSKAAKKRIPSINSEKIHESEVYWIYNFKQAAFYLFVLKGKQRDSSYEFRLRSIMEKELPIEKEVERWYPLWDIPL